MALENIKLASKSQKAVNKLFNDYSSVICEAKYKTIHGKGIPTVLARVACVVKLSDQSNLKILSPKEMLKDCQ